MNLYGSSTGLLGGTTTASTDSLGYVSFSLSVKGSAGSYYLYPVISGTTILVRALTLTLSAATAATSLKISDPGPVLIGSPFSVKVTTYIGNYGSYTTSTSITMSLSSGSFDASSTVTSSTSSGSVTFSNLILSTSMSAGTYTLTATDSGGATATLDIEASFNSQVVISMSSEPYFLKTVGTYTYYVYLSTKPSGTVSISIASGTTSIITVSPSTLNFDNSNYGTTQSVTLTVISGGVTSMSHDVSITHTISGTSPYTSGTVIFYGCDRVSTSSGTLTVTVLNTQVPGSLSLTGSFYCVEGSTNTFSIALTQAISSNVVVGLSNSDGLTFSSSSLTFTDSASQSVTVTASKGLTGSASSLLTKIEYTVTSSDSMYSSAIASSSSYVIVSSASSSAGLTQSQIPVINDQASSTSAYTISLMTTPSSSVTVTLTASSSDITISPASVSLSSTSATTISLTHVPSSYPDSLVRTYTITHSMSSSDTNYNGNSRFSIAKSLTVYVLNTCTYGQYYSSSYVCGDCPTDYRCPSPLEKYICSAGEYSTSGVYECIPCPPGYACNPSSTGKVACSAGYYSLGSATSCTQCPAGSVCTVTNAPPADCPLGTYSLAGATSCTVLTGSSVGFPWDSPTTCSSGYIPSAYRTHCEACPAGHYCSDSTTRTITPCATGYYSAGAASSCTQCPATKACSRYEEVGVCPEGYYSVAGQGSCVLCEAGYYCTSGARATCSGGYQVGLKACTGYTCPAQHYCVQGLPPLPCPPGYISASGVTTCTACTSGEYQTANTCVTCPAGFFCPTPVSPPIACYFGTYSSSGATACTICDSGYTCSQGSSSATQLSCPGGYDCTESITAMTSVTVRWPEPCAIGKYNTGTTSACSDCVAGYYCPGAVRDYQKFKCPPGHYCLAAASSPTACAAGEYNPNWGSTASSACVTCSDGYYSLKGAPYCFVCPPGSYCASGIKTACSSGYYYFGVRAILSSECKICPAGYYCDSTSNSGTIVPTPCPQYTYSTSTGLTSSSDCTNCPAGNWCPLAGSSNTDRLFSCPLGSYCTAGANYTECAAGKYSDSISGTSSSICSSCPAGYMCPNIATSSLNPKIPCSEGGYCAAGSSSATSCDAGYYSNKDYLTQSSDCTTCPAGYFCTGGKTYPVICGPGKYCPRGASSQTNCAAGTYNPFRGLTNADDCIKCPKGYQCVAGSEIPTACAAGEYAQTLGSSSCTTCPAGYYCPETAWVNPSVCGKGMFSSSGSTSCTSCTAGYYCPVEATTQTAKTSNECPAGLYCPAGTDHYPTNLYDRCSAGYYCTIHTSTETACSAGTLRRIPGGSSSTDCIDVEAGYYVSTTGSSSPTGECGAGYYCDGGSSTATEYQCPAGTYRLITGGTSDSDCGSCPAGSYCGTGTSTPTSCPTGQYCPEGDSSSPYNCPAGTYNPGTSMYKLADCIDCPKGYYCSSAGATSKTGTCTAGSLCLGKAVNAAGGTSSGGSYTCPNTGYCPAGTPRAIPCPPGKYMASTGNSDSTACVSCPVGKYCAGATNTYTGSCEAGFYCTGGASTSRQNIAAAGYYTSSGASSQTACAAGTYNPAQGQSSCLNCPAGQYCSGTGNIEGTICPAGKYCPESSSSPTNCPAGTYNPFEGMKASTDCIDCPPGYACPTTGLSSVSTTCSAGYWCYTGASSATPSTEVTDKYGPCPAGYYCIAGSSAPRPCAPGTFNSNTGSTSSSACTSCTAGSYCEGFGNSAVTGDCEAGFYCPAGQKVKRPISNICSAGYKCPTGSSTQTQCPAGTYQANKGQSTCDDCPEGFYCPAGTTDFSSNVCPAGYYCPLKTTSQNQYPCSTGTYNPIEGATSSSFCVACDPGKYCSGTGLSAVSGSCSGGYICTGSTTTSTPSGTNGQQCTAGNYCPSGSSVQIACKAGYYCATAGLSSTTGACAAGYYCTGSATIANPTSSTGGLCTYGHYCPAGSIQPIPCPAGKYYGTTGGTADTVCVSCPGGSYCQGTGQSVVTGTCTAGFYCPSGSVSPKANTCDAGYKCPAGSGSQTACDPGYYQPNRAQSSCLDCPVGYYCSTSSTTTPVICPAGYYCPVRTSSYTTYPCPAGYYNPSKGRSSSSDCVICPAGQYCGSTALTATSGECTAGYYCVEGSTSAISTICPAGYYCPAGSSYAIPCKAGKFCAGTGNTTPDGDCLAGYFCTLTSTSSTPSSSSEGGICPKGYYCPSGTATPIPCPIGTFNAYTGKSADTDCISCTAGSYCSTLAAYEVTGDCKAGFYCVTGSTSDTPDDGLCPQGSECPTGSASPTSCDLGKYGNFEGLASCFVCPSGFTCQGGTDDPVICTEGYYCPEGSSSEQPCDEKKYNPFKGQSECLDCPDGFYCTKSDPSDPITAPTICKAGFYCKDSDILPCPSGTYSDIQGLQREDNCKPCPSGKYCTSDSIDGGIIKGDCLKGYYCVSGMSVDNPTEVYTDSEVGMPCPLGYYCLVGTSTLKPCPYGKFTVSVGSDEETDCTDCSAGYYCIPGDTVPYDCPTGAYCPVASQTPSYCPIWTYSDVKNAVDLKTCKSCPKGYLCEDSGIGDYSRFPCTYGHYCLANARIENPCPIGTWGPTHALGSPDECYPCPAGSYCKTHGRATHAHCSEWNWCPEGSTKEGNCPGGYYCHQHTEVLSPCYGGYYCPATSSSAEVPPFRCQKGYYCPPGSAAPIECPWGTVYVINSLRILEADSCVSCPAGTYALDSECLPCDAGFVCEKGASNAQPKSLSTEGGYPCPPGYYCPQGSAEGVPCPVGYYYSDKGAISKSDCKPCEAGMYNDLEGQGGCYKCGPSADSTLGSTTCSCKGLNRAYMKRDATCRCQPGFSFYKEGITPSDEDSTEDCVPTVIPICDLGQIRAHNGSCVTEGQCSNSCQGGKGKRSTDLGICTCYDSASIDDVCDSSCQESTPTVKLSSSGMMVVTDPVTGKSSNVDFQSTQGYTGKPKCFDGYNCAVKTIDMTSSGSFASDYQPTLITGQGRRLASSKSIENPVYCLEYGDTMVFSILSETEYPIYLKDSLLNTNPDFDYSPFLELKKLIEKGGQNITSFAYTFTDPGRYVFANNNDQESVLLVTVMKSTQKCASPYLRERTTQTLTSAGVYQSKDKKEESNWLNFFFLTCVFIIFIIIVTIVNIFQRRNLKKMMQKNIEAYRQMLTRHASLIKMQNEGQGVMDPLDPMMAGRMGIFGRIDHINPQIFEDIYRRLGDISLLLKERANLQKAQEKDYVINLKKSLKEMKTVIHNVIHPSSQIQTVPVSSAQDELAKGLQFNPSDEPETQRLIEKIVKDPVMTEKIKQELLDELKNNFSSLEAQLAEDRVQAANTLKNRIDQRNRGRRELMLKKQRLEEQERNLREEMQREVKDADSMSQQFEKDYEKDKRRAREKVFGNTAKNMRKDLLEKIRKNPENEELFISQYEAEMSKLERNLDDEKGKAHRDLLKRIEDRKNERKRQAQLRAENLVKEHSEVTKELDRVVKQIELSINIEAETQVEVPMQKVVDLSEGDERNIDRKFKEMQKNSEIQHDHKQSSLEKEKQKLTNSLGFATTPAERDRILNEMQKVDDALQEAIASREADQKKILAERLKERRRLRKERQEKHVEVDQQFEANTVSMAVDDRIRRLQEIVNGLPEDKKIATIKQMLSDKHDQELLDLQGKQQKRAAQLHAGILREALDNKAEASRLAPSYLSSLKDEQQKQAISSILLEGEKESQSEFQKQWKLHQRRCNDELLKLLDTQMREVADTLSRLGINSAISPEAQELDREFKARQSEMEREAHERLVALEKQRDEMTKLAKEKQDELEKEIEAHRRLLEVEKAKKALEAKQKKELEEKVRKEGLSQKQIEQLIAQHQRELALLESNLEAEKRRQKEMLEKKLEEKRNRRRKLLQVPEDLKHVGVETAQMMKQFRNLRHEEAGFDDNLLDELLRRISRIEQVVANIDDKQFNNVMDRLNELTRGMRV